MNFLLKFFKYSSGLVMVSMVVRTKHDWWATEILLFKLFCTGTFPVIHEGRFIGAFKRSSYIKYYRISSPSSY